MNFEILEEAKAEIMNLPSKELQLECLNLLKDLRAGKVFGQRLENKNGRDLSTCFKLYFHNAQYRIIYQISPEGMIIAVGLRQSEEVYKIAAERLGK